MKKETDLKKKEGGLAEISQSDHALIAAMKASLYPGARDESVVMVLAYCKKAKLDPMTKPVHIVPMYIKDAKTDKKEYRDVIMPGIELYRTKAARTGEYAGINEAEFGENVTEKLGTSDFTYPKYCVVTVYRLVKGLKVSFSSGKVFWKETYSTASYKTTEPNAMWKKRPYGQIEKCAESMALRRAFPEIGAQPTVDEMAGKEIGLDDATVIEAEGAIVTEEFDMPSIDDDRADKKSKEEIAEEDSFALFTEKMDEAKARIGEAAFEDCLKKLKYKTIDEVPRDKRMDVYSEMAKLPDYQAPPEPEKEETPEPAQTEAALTTLDDYKKIVDMATSTDAIASIVEKAEDVLKGKALTDLRKYSDKKKVLLRSKAEEEK